LARKAIAPLKELDPAIAEFQAGERRVMQLIRKTE